MKLRLSTLRWPLTAATAGVAVLWAGSMFASAWWAGSEWGAWLKEGSTVVARSRTVGWRLGPAKGLGWYGWAGWSYVRVWPVWSLQDPNVSWVIVPLWMPLVVSGVFTARSWRSHRARTTAADRARTGACPRCGYAREGLAPAAPCPECAFVPPPPPPPTPPPAPLPGPS